MPDSSAYGGINNGEEDDGDDGDGDDDGDADDDGGGGDDGASLSAYGGIDKPTPNKKLRGKNLLLSSPCCLSIQSVKSYRTVNVEAPMMMMMMMVCCEKKRR